MKFNEIHIRDPFILPHEGTYYLYGTRGKMPGKRQAHWGLTFT